MVLLLGRCFAGAHLRVRHGTVGAGFDGNANTIDPDKGDIRCTAKEGEELEGQFDLPDLNHMLPAAPICI